MESIENQLQALPTYEEIRNEAEWVHTQLTQRTMESYFASGHTFNNLSFERKRKIVTLIFGGKDENGKRYGIYIKPLGGNPKTYKFVGYGRLGNIHGWVESRTGNYDADAYDVWTRKSTSESEAHVEVARVVRNSDIEFFREYEEHGKACTDHKAYMLGGYLAAQGFCR